MSHVVVAPAAGGPAGASIKPRRRILQKLRDPIGSSVDVSGHLSTCVRFSSMFANDTASGYQTTSSVQEKSGEGGVQLRMLDRCLAGTDLAGLENTMPQSEI